MLTFKLWPLLVTLLFSGLNNLYLCLLLHWRYSGQFGRGFILMCACVFSLPSLLLLGFPCYLILIAPAEPPLRALLLCVLLFICLRLQMRLTRRLLNRRFPARTTDQSSDNAAV